MVVCHTLTNIPRVDFTKVSSTSPGRFHLLGSISHVEKEGDNLELVRGLCQECGKFNILEMFEKRGSDIFCCKRGRVTLWAKKILQEVMFVTEGKGEEAEMISMLEEESYMITSNTSVLEEARSPIIVRKDAAVSVSLNIFRAPRDDGVPHPDQHPQSGLHQGLLHQPGQVPSAGVNLPCGKGRGQPGAGEGVVPGVWQVGHAGDV
jgi:hypothetical protein